jgi:hypothetical protein
MHHCTCLKFVQCFVTAKEVTQVIGALLHAQNDALNSGRKLIMITGTMMQRYTYNYKLNIMSQGDRDCVQHLPTMQMTLKIYF